MTTTAECDRLFPAYDGGPLVGEVAFEIVCYAFPRGIPDDVEVVLEVHEEITVREVVDRLVEFTGRDEADVLRGLAELTAVGLLFVDGNRRGNV
jgi:hypothetical protein